MIYNTYKYPSPYSHCNLLIQTTWPNCRTFRTWLSLPYHKVVHQVHRFKVLQTNNTPTFYPILNFKVSMVWHVGASPSWRCIGYTSFLLAPVLPLRVKHFMHLREMLSNHQNKNSLKLKTPFLKQIYQLHHTTIHTFLYKKVSDASSTKLS